MDSPNPFESTPPATASAPPLQQDNNINEENSDRSGSQDELDRLEEHEYLEDNRTAMTSNTTADDQKKEEDSNTKDDDDDGSSSRLPRKTFQLTNLGRQPSVLLEEEGDTSKPLYSPVTLELPHINCQEKIVICVDLSEEINRVPFYSRDGTKQIPLDVIKRALSIFVRTKIGMNPKHEFALVIFQESFVWIQDFTSRTEDFLKVVKDLTTDGREPDTCNLTSLFEILEENIRELPDVENRQLVPPPYTVRTLLVYGRSHVVPAFEGSREAQGRLSNSPYFFFDVFYLHEPPTEENQCKEIFDTFLDLDKEGTSYIHEVGRNTTHVYDKFAMVLAHPLQRQLQEVCNYSIFSKP